MQQQHLHDATTVTDFIHPDSASYDYVADSFTVATDVTSNCEFSVVVNAFGTTTPLVYGGRPARWRATLDITGKPRGPFDVVVTATDVNGATATRSITLFHDTRPVITVTLPMPALVASPSLHFTATCADDDTPACSTFAVRAFDDTGAAQALLSGSSIDGDASLAAFEGKVVRCPDLWQGQSRRGRATSGITWPTRPPPKHAPSLPWSTARPARRSRAATYARTARSAASH